MTLIIHHIMFVFFGSGWLLQTVVYWLMHRIGNTLQQMRVIKIWKEGWALCRRLRTNCQEQHNRTNKRQQKDVGDLQKRRNFFPANKCFSESPANLWALTCSLMPLKTKSFPRGFGKWFRSGLSFHLWWWSFVEKHREHWPLPSCSFPTCAYVWLELWSLVYDPWKITGQSTPMIWNIKCMNCSHLYPVQLPTLVKTILIPIPTVT